MAFTESRNRIMEAAAKVETTYGTDPTIAGANNGFNAIDSDVPWNADIAMAEFRNHGTSFTRGKDVPGIRLGRFTITAMLQGSGTAGTAVQGIDDMLQGCGLHKTVAASTSVTYSPASIANLKSVAIKTNMNGLTATSFGCYGNVVFSAEAGAPFRSAFTMQGLYQDPVIGTIASWAPGATGADRARPFLSASAVIANGTDTWTGATVLNASLDMGSDIRQIPDANSSTGLKKLLFADRNPSGSLGIVMDTDTAGAIIQANEFYTNMLASTTHDLVWSINGGAGNINTFNVDFAQLRSINVAPGDGFRRFDLVYKVQHATADSEMSLVQT